MIAQPGRQNEEHTRIHWQDGVADKASETQDHSYLAAPNIAASILSDRSTGVQGKVPANADAMQSAQQTQGNRAVQRIIQRTAATQSNVQRDADAEEVAKSVVGDSAVKAGDPTDSDT